MSILSSVQTDATIANEAAEDSTGPSYLVDSGMYLGVIDSAYIKKSGSSNALALALDIKLQNGTTVSEDIYFTNKAGQTFYTRDGKNNNLPGFNLVNSLAQVTLGKSFLDLDPEIQEKQIMLYSYDEKKKVPTTAKVVVPLINQKVQVGVLRTYQDIGDKENNYEPSGFSYESNVLDKFFNAESGKTHGEQLKGQEATFKAKWEASNTGVIRDKTKNKIGLNKKPKDGAPAAAASNAAGTTTQSAANLFPEEASADPGNIFPSE